MGIGYYLATMMGEGVKDPRWSYYQAISRLGIWAHEVEVFISTELAQCGWVSLPSF